MSITSKFLKVFDANEPTHVQWLAKMNDVASSMGDPSAHISLVAEVNKNPMKIQLDQRDALDWPNIHFVLSASYAKAVLKGEAFIPVTK
jgi:hypothetical protein